MGPGENAGAVDVGDGLAVRVQGRVAQPPERGRAVPGRGHRRRRDPARHLRDRRAADRGARLAALRRARLRALALPARPRRRRHRPLRQLDRRADGRRRGLLRGALRAELPRQRDVRSGSRRRERADPLAPRPGVGNLVVLFGASTGRDGIGGASVLASRRARRGRRRTSARPCRSATRSRRASCSSAASSCSSSGLLVSLQDLGAAGLTSSRQRDGLQGRRRHRHRRRPRAAARGRHGAVRDHGLASRRSGCSASSSPTRLDDGARALRHVGGPRRPSIGEVTDTGHMRIFDGGELVGDMPVAALVDDCPLYDLAPAPPAEPLYPAPPATLLAAAPRRATTLLALLASAEHRLAPPAVRAVRLDRPVAHRPPARGGRRRRARAARGGGAIAVSIDGNGRRVAADPYRGHDRGRARVRRRTSPASAPSRSGLTNYLNFGNPEKPHIAWQLDRGGARASATPAARSSVPIVGGNVSLYNEGADGPIYPTPVSAWSASCPTPRAPAGSASPREGDAVALVGHVRAVARRRASWPSCAASRCPTACPPFDIDAGARGAGRDPRRGPRRRCSPAPTTSPRAASLVARRRVLPGRRHRRDARPRRRRDDPWTPPVRRGPRRLRRLRHRATALAAARRARAARRVRRGRRRRARRRDRRRGARRRRSASCARPTTALRRFFP